MSDNLELLAMHFLRFEKRCRVALFERTPRHGHGLPDVLGITQSRHLLEIEVKRSYSDFRANANKPHIRRHEIGVEESLQPKSFWYLVPPELVKKVEPQVPKWAGLMRGPGRNEVQQVYVVKKAPTNALSARLTTRQMVELAHCMANQILAQAKGIESLRNTFRFGHQPWLNPNADHYDI